MRGKNVLRKRIICVFMMVCAAGALLACGGGTSGVSQEEYDALKTQYEELATYADSLEEKVFYLEAINSAYDAKLNEYIEQEQAGNKVIIVEPITAEEE